MALPRLSLLVLLFLLFPAAGNAAPGEGVGAAAATKGGAFNITEILGRFPEFTLFNFLLSKTRVCREINSRGTVTLLAPVNADVDWLLRRSARMPRAALVELLSVHVVLDYIDASKLAALPRGGRPIVATTLFQTSGTALNRSGFLTITATGNGGAVFASAAPGALVNATFKKAVTAKPYNISVLQISNFVVPPGVITRPRPATPTPPRMRSMAIAPSPAPVPARTSPPVTMPVEDTTEEEITAPAPAPSQGHATQVISWWSGVGAALGMACMSWYL